MNKKYISLIVAATLLTACGGGSSSSSKNDGEGSIDLLEYFPAQSMTKTFSSVQRDGTDVSKSHYDEIIDVSGNTIITTINTEISEKVVFSDTNVTTTSFDKEDGNEVEYMYRHVDVGDTFVIETMKRSENTDLGKTTLDITYKCKLKSKETKFERDDNVYSGDLLKLECIAEGEVILDIKTSLLDLVSEDLNGSHEYYNTSYVYLKKGLGRVAEINDDCIPNKKLPTLINDKKTECAQKQYDNEYYLP